MKIPKNIIEIISIVLILIVLLVFIAIIVIDLIYPKGVDEERTIFTIGSILLQNL
jgi:hypothetical protein